MVDDEMPVIFKHAESISTCSQASVECFFIIGGVTGM